MREEIYYEVPDGRAGILATLSRMAEIIRDHPSMVGDFAASFREQVEAIDPTLTDAEHAATIFNWVHAHMLYVEDETMRPDGAVLQDVLKRPEVSLDEILRLGSSFGDCDDQILLLGSLYHDSGYGVILVNVTTLDGIEHVYLRVITPEGVFAADPIVKEDFGWELPEEERSSTVELPV